MKKIISLLFVLIICIQCLPVKEIGKCIYDNTFIEEEMAKKVFKNPTLPLIDLISNSALFCSPDCTVATYYFSNTRLHKHPVTEVTTPPPNA
ncbi:MAG: hypothetical protein JSU03_01515 [Bacteroidetes bacterium]|nr:hypothetical protein [Bacteroidota bacterium]MBS1755933.1 hypothetical protein [Bacteroidota bacterium]